MFTKYLNQFGKAEAEWVLEVLDMHGGNEPAARAALVESVGRIIASRKVPGTQLSEFDRMVDAACFAAGDWWGTGLQKLRELGKICRRCSECVGMNHHWTPDPIAPDDPEWKPGDYACKHCEQRGDGCSECEEDGYEVEGVMSSEPCDKCGGEGVIPLTTEEYAHAMQLSVEER